MDYFKSKKFRLLLAMLSFLVLVNVVQESYAKYISSASADSNFSIAQWTFKVNAQDVLNNSDFSANIVPMIDSNIHIKDGYIAPTSTGYFDITVDYTGIGVSFNEQLSLEPGTNSIDDFIVTGYTLNDGELITFDNDNYAVSLDHLLTDTNPTSKDIYRFYVKWIDGENETMDNAADTEATKNETANIKVNLKFVQIAN